MPKSSASIEIKGVDKLIVKLGKVAAVETLREPMRESFDIDIRPEAKKYPPERPGQTYVRTFRLRDNWNPRPTLQASQNGLTGQLSNRTKYGPYVQGWDTQAWMHQGRWSTNRSILDKLAGNISRRFKRAIDEALK